MNEQELTTLQQEADSFTAAIAAVHENRANVIQALLAKREALKQAFSLENENITSALRALGWTRKRVTEVTKKAAKRGRPKKTSEVAEGGGASGGN